MSKTVLKQVKKQSEKNNLESTSIHIVKKKGFAGNSDQLGFQFGNDLTLPDIMEMCLTTALVAMQKHGKDEQVYDAFNIMATNVLAQYIPDNELRPNINEEIIKKAEEIVLNEHAPSPKA